VFVLVSVLEARSANEQLTLFNVHKSSSRIKILFLIFFLQQIKETKLKESYPCLVLIVACVSLGKALNGIASTFERLDW